MYFPVLVLLIYVLAFVGYYYFAKAKNSLIVSAFSGVTTVLGHIRFNYKNSYFVLAREGHSSRYGGGGSHAVLWTLLQPTDEFTICTSKTRKYLYLFGFPKNHFEVEFDGVKLVFVSKSEESLQKLRRAAGDTKLLQVLKALLNRDFSYIKVSKEYYFLSQIWPSRCFVLKYSYVNELVYKDISMLQAILDNINLLQTRLHLNHFNPVE